MMKRLLLTILTLFVMLTLPVNAAELTASGGSGGTTITATTNLQNAPSFTVSIPSGIPIGALTRTATSTLHSTDFSVGILNAAALDYSVVTVSISAPDDRFCLYNDVYELPYLVLVGEEKTSLAVGGVFARFASDTAASVSGSIVVDRADITAEGTYSGTLIFTVKTEAGG